MLTLSPSAHRSLVQGHDNTCPAGVSRYFMNIIYCHDGKLNNLLERSKESFLFHNPDVKFFEITEDKENLLKDFTQELCGFGHVSKACFLRLLIPKVFPELDRALYVDVKNVPELYKCVSPTI